MSLQFSDYRALFAHYLAIRETPEPRAANPNGMHRLAHLVPEFAPDQPALACVLAEMAIAQRLDGLREMNPGKTDKDILHHDAMPPDVWTLVNGARRSSKDLEWMVERAPKDPYAWRACEAILNPAYRCRIEDGKKIVDPIPAPIQELMERHFRGEVARPPLKWRFETRDDIIRLAVWMALEADVPATGRDGSGTACAIVSHVLRENGLDKIDHGSVRLIWQRRSVSKGREN